MGSSPRASKGRSGIRLLALAAALALGTPWLIGCAVGAGTGNASGVINVPQCDIENAPYALEPSFWAAEVVVDDQLEIRMQRSGALESASDGVRLLVEDTALIKEDLLGVPIDLGGFQPPVTMSLYLNETCPVEFDRIPVNYESVSGTITFEGIYAPSVDSDDLRITATWSAVRLEAASRSADHYAEIDGALNFVFNRGRPAQRYP